MKFITALTVAVGFLGLMNFIGKTSRESQTKQVQQITPFDSHGAKAGELWKALANN